MCQVIGDLRFREAIGRLRPDEDALSCAVKGLKKRYVGGDQPSQARHDRRPEIGVILGGIHFLNGFEQFTPCMRVGEHVWNIPLLKR